MWGTSRHESERKKRWYRWIYRPKTAQTAKGGKGNGKGKGIHHHAATLIVIIFIIIPVMTTVISNITYTEVLRMKSSGVQRSPVWCGHSHHVLYYISLTFSPVSCPGAKLILGHQFPEIIWATSKVLICPMIMAPQSPGRNFFIARAP